MSFLLADDLAIIAIAISIGSFLVAAIGVAISWKTYSRSRAAVKISAENLPPYKGEEKTLFLVQNVGSADLVNPETIVRPSWSREAETYLDWGETMILSPPNVKSIEYRLPDPPIGQHRLEVQVIASGISLPIRTFEVNRTA